MFLAGFPCVRDGKSGCVPRLAKDGRFGQGLKDCFLDPELSEWAGGGVEVKGDRKWQVYQVPAV